MLVESVIRRALPFTAALLLAVSACGPNGSNPTPPRNPPAQHSTWLSKKANSAAEADQYYREIGAITPGANGAERREVLDDFKSRNGFNANDGAEIAATYFNEADLQFGRDMHCRRRPAQSQILACYVANYGPPPFDASANGANPAWPNQNLALTDAVAKQHAFATVAMEARNVPETASTVVLESNGDAPPNLVCGTVGTLPTPCDLHDADTGVDILAGDSVAIAATGTIWSGILGAPPNDANGDNTSTNGNFPLPSARAFSLIGRLGPGFSYFPIGTARVIKNTSTVAKRLFLRSNDDVPSNGNGQFNVTITYLNRVNFYTYDGNNQLVSTAALDSEGGKPTPGICMACHGGRFDKTSKPGSIFVVGATYLPFDVQSFGYPGAAGFGINDQQEAFRKLNALVVESRPNETNSNHPIVRFINSLYQTGAGGVHGAGNTAGNAVTPAGWAGHDPSYQWVSKPYCQMCHMTLDESKDFTTFANFSGLTGPIQADVCNGNGRIMPHAQVPFDKFWKITLPDAPAQLAADIGVTACSP
jgi:hypothetical protein